ncbi:dentin sialophosphoprotein-like isoform X1 [Sinocyclocheilus grahami]|uniref:dentin sialophosphoprotein-like isoform X1 n=1 Tax=Sinocyclocheilus grahami TaxID=75366 RepID=UPI0007AC9F49|nr:PREDICTED: dentin sialophosphoprotein-like isoform X1 [Sinocyclocheilus grahami]
MKTVIVLTLLIATVFCLPVKRSASSSESSEELVVVQRPPPILQKAAAVMFKAEPTQTTPAESNESTDSADDSEDADEESETDEREDENDTDSSESESGESAITVVPSTVEPSLDPIINTGRGDSMGYPSDYKKNIVYVDANNFEKLPSPYKSYSSDKLGGLTFVSKKSSDQSINDVEKEIKLYKALQVHDTLLEEEDTSTPEVQNMEPNDRQVALGSQDIVPTGNQDATAESDSEGASAGDTPNDSTSASASQEQNEEESDSSPSSEETTATPGAADSEDDSSQSTESQESDSDEETTQTTDATVIIAK